MPGKYESTVELATQTAQQITSGGRSYMAFLTTAAHNFKYSFMDQLLIFAQKPDATACAEIDFWNAHGRWVNRGTRGIALLVDTTASYKLRHVFDMSDTNSPTGRIIPVWQMSKQYEDAVIEGLENSYGEFEGKPDFAACLLEAARIIVEDNFADYYANLLTLRKDSLLEELDDASIETWFKVLLQNSVAFMLLTRCGIDAGNYFSEGDFAHIYEFNTPETISILGTAASDISEMALREIASTVLTLQREEQKRSRTFAKRDHSSYDRPRGTNTERSAEHESELQDGRGLPTAQPDHTGHSQSWEVWNVAAQPPSQSQERDLHRDGAVREAEQPSDGGGAAGHRDGEPADSADGDGAGRDREPEGIRPDEVGGPDEQHQGGGGGTGVEGTDLQLTSPEPQEEGAFDWTAVGPTGLQFSHHNLGAPSETPYYHEDGEKNELLRTSDALKDHRVEIATFFAAHEGSGERGDFIKSFFNNTLTEKILSTDQRAGYRAFDDALHIYRGSWQNPQKEVFMRWDDVAVTIYGMILLDQWLDPDEHPLPSEAEQISIIEQTKTEKASAFALPQEAIDYILCGGSGVSLGKLRIYEQFLKKEDKQANIKFLKEEYGIGGRSNAIPGSGYWEGHDNKGITISRGYGDGKDKFLLTWAKVEKRIGELIAAERYLTQIEKEQYPIYLIQCQEREDRRRVADEIHSIIDDYIDFKTQLGETEPGSEIVLTRRCTGCFVVGEKKFYGLKREGDFVLPILRQAMQTIISNKTHLTERCEAILVELNSPLAAPLEPTYEELHPPKKEYRCSVGDIVYLGTQEYELLAFDEQSVRLSDLEYPIISKDLPRDEFERLLVENPLNDHLLHLVESPPETEAPKYDLGFGHLGNGVTVWNRLEKEQGDYKIIAHIAPDRNVTFYDEGLPEDVRARITQFAATAEMTISATQDASVFSIPPLEKEPLSNNGWSDYNPLKEQNPDSLVLYQVGDFFEIYGEDAQIAAHHFGCTLSARNIPDIGRISMCGFPAHLLESYTNRLNSAGFDVVTASLEESHRKISNHPAPIMEKAKRLIDDFCQSEYGSPADFTNMREIGVGHTTVTDDELPIQVYVNLVDFCVDRYVTDVLVDQRQYSSLQEMIDKELAVLNFDDLIYFTDEELAKVQEQEQDDFADIDPIALRSALAERGIIDGQLADSHQPSSFVQQVMADVEQIAADNPPPSERFSIIETDTGYAVWDDLRSEIYVDDEGIQEDFASEWQAEDYLERVRRAVADKEAAEWLTVEQAKQDIPAKDTEHPTDGYGDLIGRELVLDGHRFVIESIGDISGDVSLRDLTFTGNTGFPINRVEKIGTVQKLLEQAEKTPEPLPAPSSPPRNKMAPAVLYPEIPAAQRHDYHITDNALGVGTPSERFANNVAAIRLLKKLEEEKRLATPEEQETLSRYVGWGGLADCFDERHSRYAELRALLTEDEYPAARESTLTAFYTPPIVIRAIYQALTNMGFQTGNILEPSCGTGNFIGMTPEKLAGSKIYGIELDSISGRIAQQLYQTSSVAVQGFEKTDLPDSFFDAAIGNVPFGSFKVPDKRYDKHNFLIHDYFFARTLDKVRPGGIIAFITSKGTMDKENPSVRKYIAQRADLLGAIRLPNDTFKAAAGTDVTSDILFLQKRDSLSYEEPAWVHLNADENGLKINQYFIDNPDMVMGEMREISGPFEPETACLPYAGQDLEDQLAAAIQNIHGDFAEYTTDDPEAEEEDHSIPADPSVKNFSYTVVDGEIYYRENSRMNPVEVSMTAANRIKGLVELRDCVRTLIDYQTEDYPEQDIQTQRQRLNALYDTFTKKYGRITSRANNAAFNADSAYFLLSSLEVLDDEGNFVRKADMFTKRTIKQKVAVTSVDTASEALAVSLAERACIDLGYMASLMGGGDKIPQIVEDLQGVIFKDPATDPFDIEDEGAHWYQGWQTADEYLSGNVREKLAVAKLAAENHPSFAQNVQALERVQPVDLTASEISVRLGATWLPKEVIEDFMFELLGTPRYSQMNIHVHYSIHSGEWNVEGKSYDRGNVKANSTYGTDRINAYKIIEETLNLRDVRIFDYIHDEDGKKKAVLNKKETAIAQGKQELIKQAFQDWIWKDPQRREQLCRLYNDKFNSIRPREYDGSHLNFVGMNPEITLRKHQVNAIARILYGGNTLLAHVVGAGKTFEMVAAAQESKRLGLCQKSLFVVPNHLTEQWAAEYLQLYPSANILVATKKDFETKNRKRFCGRIATGDYDAIIIGHSQFEKIPVSIERQRHLLEQQKIEILNGIRELKESHGERFTIKQLERSKKTIQAKLDKLNDQSRKDDVVTFEELGVDRLFVDEAHYYKNLAAFSKMRNVGGISQTEAQKSSDLYMKCRYLDELTGCAGVIFATGTPISNTMVELYTMQKYLQYAALKERGLLHFDAWASTFGETVTAIELAPEGTGYRSKTRFAKFYNLPELMAMFREVADIQTADMLNLPVPKANYHNIALKPSDQQKEMVAGLAKRAERVRNRMVDSSEDNMLLITNDGRKLALDQRLMNDLLPDSDTSKVSACADDVFKTWQSTADKHSTQMVFCDLSIPRGDGNFNIYDDLRDKLIAKGIPAEEIAYIHFANTEVQKKELFGKVRSGQIRVLLGSTQKMGAGTNVQKKLVALYHMDCPWRPSDLQQREGRIVRQGNENDEVDIYTYVTENTFDSYLYQLVEGKQKFIGQIMTGKSPVRSADDVDATALSYAEIKALSTGNPHIKEKMDLDIEVQRLKLLKANHLSQRYSLEDQIIKEFPQRIASYEQRIEGYTADIALLAASTRPNADGFSPMEVNGKVCTDKKEAGEAIIAACKAMKNPDPVSLGQYRGFSMELVFDSLSQQYKITLRGRLSHTTALGTDIFGNILRLDNLLGGFEEQKVICQEQLENVKTQLANAQTEVKRQFSKENELKEKMARLDELNILLNMDKVENEILDGEREEDEIPDREIPDRER